MEESQKEQISNPYDEYQVPWLRMFKRNRVESIISGNWILYMYNIIKVL